MNFARWIAIAYLAGSLPFSVWIGRIFLRQDIRRVGDHNPGATNVLRAGGRGLALAALALDFLKGAIPVGLAYRPIGFDSWQLATIALMPVLGHASSPFLRFRGGKAVAVTGGIWCGLTAWEGPTVGGTLLGVGTYLLGANGWAVLFGMCGMLLYFALVPPFPQSLFPRPNFSTLLLVWIGNMSILIWKYRADLTRGPALRFRRESGR